MNPAVNILCATSYFNGMTETPEIITRLDELLVQKSENGYGISNIDLAEHINNLIVKYGFLLIVKPYLEKSINGNQAETNFFLSNFIFNTKAFLDSTAILLNYFYKLGLNGGNVDLRKTLYMDALKKNNADIEFVLQKQRQWINSVVEWRDEIIHRSSVASIIFSPPDETGKRPKDNIIGMPTKPTSIFDLIRRQSSSSNQLKNQNVLHFYNDWTIQAKTMFDTILSFIERDIRNLLAK